MTLQWPDRIEREEWEIREFIAAYARLPEGRTLKVLKQREKPDYRVVDPATDLRFGVELTSVYLDDRSVPDEHIPGVPEGELRDIPYDLSTLDRYKHRLVAAVEDNMRKARNGYDTFDPLILSVYVNEYVAIHLTYDDVEALVRQHKSVFDNMAPFSEIVFWNLSNNGVFAVRP